MANGGNSMRVIGIALAILILGAIFVAMYVRATYNDLVGMQEQAKTAWAQVENQLQRRNDLIPNYVETVKGYAKQETTIFTAIADARARMAGARGNPAETIQANNQLESALARLLVVVENYPVLKSSENFQRLQDELAGTENRIATERMRYNEVVRDYNVRIRRFPANLVAGAFNFAAMPLFEAPEAAKQVPQVKF
ncbi:MAG TPA: LemA family protein [Candidatus Eisenbacteria bacterium]|nr:LemA family protein [Candidatus Eisenbacteria bacterium]